MDVDEDLTLDQELRSIKAESQRVKESFLKQSVELFHSTLENRNATRLVSFYHDSNETLVSWHNQAGILAGDYQGEYIFLLYGYLLGHSLEIHTDLLKYNATLIQDDIFLVEIDLAGSGKHDI